MRRYDEPIEVKRGLVAGQEAPEQFIWRDRLWVVRDVISHWVETGAWWEQAGVAALLGVGAEREVSRGGIGREGVAGRASREEAASTGVSAVPLGADLLAELDVWRVEAVSGRGGRGARSRGLIRRTREVVEEVDDPGYGVFDLAFDWAQARWRLVGCAD